jgi:hypothetical protein
MKIKINEQDYDNKVLFHLVRVDSYLNECPKCKGDVFKAKVEQGDLGVVFYKTVCVKCDYEQLDGTYVSTISECKDGCVLK